MSNSHQVIISTEEQPRNAGGGAPFDTNEPELALELFRRMGGGPKKTSARANIMPDVGVARGKNSPMLEPRMAGGVRPNQSNDPRDLVVEVGGVSMTLAMAQQLGLVTQNASGQREFVPEVVSGKVAEGRQANAQTDAEAMPIANQETAEWLDQVDQACTAAGMSAGLDDLVHAAMHVSSPQEVIDLFAGISDTPAEAAADFASVVETWTVGLADALGMEVEEVDDLLDAAVEQHGLGAVVGRALAGAHRKSYAPILAMIKHRLA